VLNLSSFHPIIALRIATLRGEFRAVVVPYQPEWICLFCLYLIRWSSLWYNELTGYAHRRSAWKYQLVRDRDSILYRH
jgi:hypothetical protein